MALGQDANWDLRNYHVYNPWALLNGRLGLDLLPAGIQSTFNPLLDLPYYLLATGLLANSPHTMAAVAGLPFGGLLFVVLQLATWLLPPSWPAVRLTPWIATAIAGTAAATFSEIGTTFNDIPVAGMTLAAFLAGAHGATKGWVWSAAAAGALTGAAVAFKPTAIVFAPGELAGLLVLAASWPARVRFAGAFSTSAAVVALAVGGPWAWVLTRHYGSPVFPMMNAVFGSEWYPPTNIVDPRFMPRTIWQAWLYPFFWLHRQTLVTESSMRDARMACAMLALPVIILAACRRELPQPRRVLAVVVFTVTSYIPWIMAFSILRYAIVLEALAALLILVGVNAAAALAAPGRRSGAAALAGCLLLVCLLRHTEPPDWWRIPYGQRVLEVEHVALPPRSLILVASAPTAMILPFVDALDFSAVGLTDETLGSEGYRLFAEIARRVDEQRDPIFILSNGELRATEAAGRFGLTAELATCVQVRVSASFKQRILLCPALTPGVEHDK